MPDNARNHSGSADEVVWDDSLPHRCPWCGGEVTGLSQEIERDFVADTSTRVVAYPTLTVPCGHAVTARWEQGITYVSRSHD